MPNEQKNKCEQFNFKNLCRVCLTSASETINIFTNPSLHETSVGKVIQYCTDIEIQSSENHPHCICIKCLKLLQSAYTFKNVLIKSNLALKENETYDNEATLNTIKTSIEESHVWKNDLNIFRKDCTYDYLRIISDDIQNDVHKTPSTEMLLCEESNALNNTESVSDASNKADKELIYSKPALITNSTLNVCTEQVSEQDPLPTEIICIEAEKNELSNVELDVSACISDMVQNVVDLENEKDNPKESCQIIEINDDDNNIDEIQIVCETSSKTVNSSSADNTSCNKLKEVLADNSDLLKEQKSSADKSDIEIVNIDCEVCLDDLNVNVNIDAENEETISSENVQVIEINDDENNLSCQTSGNTSLSNTNNSPCSNQPKLVILSNEVVTNADIASEIIKARQSLDSNSLHNATDMVIDSVMNPNNDDEFENNNENITSNNQQNMVSVIDCNNVEMIDESENITQDDLINEDIGGQAIEVSNESVDGANTILIEHDSEASECGDDPVEYISTEDLGNNQDIHASTATNPDESDDEVILVAMEEDINSIFEVIDLTEKNSVCDSESMRSGHTKVSISSVQRQNLKIVFDLITDLKRSVAESREKVHDLTDDKADEGTTVPKTRAERRKARKQRKSKEKSIRKMCLHLKRMVRENLPEKMKKIHQIASNKGRSIEDELKLLENLINKRPKIKLVHKRVDNTNASTTNATTIIDDQQNEQPVANQSDPINNEATLTKELVNKNLDQEKQKTSPFKKPNNDWFVRNYLQRHTIRDRPYPVVRPNSMHVNQNPNNFPNWDNNINWETNPINSTFHIGQNTGGQCGNQTNHPTAHRNPMHTQIRPQFNNTFGCNQGSPSMPWQWQQRRPPWLWNRPYRPKRFYNKSNFWNKKNPKRTIATSTDDLSTYGNSETTGRTTSTSIYSETDDLASSSGRTTSTSTYSEFDKDDLKIKLEIKDEIKYEWETESFISDCSKLRNDIHIKKEEIDLDIVKVEA